MVTIKPIKERELLEQLNEQENTNAYLGYALYDQNEITGYLLYNLHETCGEFVAIKANSLAEKDGLIRAVMASLLELGIDQVVLKAGFPVALLRELNIIEDYEYSIASIQDVLSKTCAAKKK